MILHVLLPEEMVPFFSENTPFAVHYEKIRTHLRELRTNEC